MRRCRPAAASPPGSSCLGCLGCFGSLAVFIVIAAVVGYLGGITSTLEIIILLVTVACAIRVLIYTILNIKEGLSMNFFEFGDFLPLLAGIGAGLMIFFFLTPHNIDLALCLGVFIANVLVRR